MVRMSLAEGRPLEAHKVLSEQLPYIEKKLDTSDVLHYELAYIKGETAFQQHNFALATQFFEKSLPTRCPNKCTWYSETLYRLGWCFLKMGEDKAASLKQKTSSLKKAEDYFQSVLKVNPEERSYLALGQCYLTRGNHLDDDSGYSQAEALLSNRDLFNSREGQAHALLLRAEAAPSYTLRDNLYRQLTQDSNKESSFYGRSWYLRAWNAFEEGQHLFKQKEREKALVILEKASSSFAKAYELLKDKDPACAASAIKYQAIATGYKDTDEANKSALELLNALMLNSNLALLDDPGEIYYLCGFYCGRLANNASAEKNTYRHLAEQSLWQAANLGPKDSFQDTALQHLGAFYYGGERYTEAETAYLQLVNSFPLSPLAGEALFWAAKCADETGQPQLGKERRQRVYTEFPASPFAAEAFFSLYSPQDYLQGNRQAIKHLQLFIESYSDTPLLLQANYWLGLDNKRNRKTEEGKWIRKRNLTEAINAFYQVEQQFETFADKEMIAPENLYYYLTMRYRALLERAKANLTIAEESQGAKQRIYLEYARDLFKELFDKFGSIDDPRTILLSKEENYPALIQEASLYLAQTLIQEENDLSAEKVLSQMIDRYNGAKITRGYFLSRGWSEWSNIAMRRNDYIMGLAHLKQAQDAAKGNILSTDQRLDLFIQESMCYRGLKQWDNAILVLSKAVNDDAISSLRLKAMYLRAEIYELQGRPELARKQLDSMANKGGPWALKAKEKLEKDYGY
jgi:TolA-binding protein